MEISGRDRSLIERLVVAVEKLSEDQVLEIESGPPICPHCDTFAPDVTVEETTGTGPLSEYLVKPTCRSCGNQFYAVPIEWALFTTYQEAEAEVKTRREVFSVNGN